MTMKDLEDCRRRHVSLVVPLQIQADSDRTVTPLLPNAKDQRDDLGRNAKSNFMRSPGHVPETCYPVLLIALLPDIEECPRDSKKTGKSD